MLAFRRKASRDPVYPPISQGRVLYVVGDIHGRSDLLDRLHASIDADHTGRTEEATEIYLGDYVDRGPDSKGVIDRLIDRHRDRLRDRNRAGQMIFLRGNHEELFSQFLDGRLDVEGWRRVGGFETALSYGVDVGGLIRAPMSRWTAALAHSVPSTHRVFLASLGDYHVVDGYVFVHAGIRPGTAIGDQTPDDLYWIRDEFIGDETDHGAIVVHGHTPTEAPEFLANRINIDTGAYLSNRLTCLVIDADGVRLL